MTREQWITHLTILGWEARRGRVDTNFYRLGVDGDYLFCDAATGPHRRKGRALNGIPVEIAKIPRATLDKFIAYLEQNHEQPETHIPGAKP